MANSESQKHPGSFRDPAGHILTTRNGVVYRQVNIVGKDDYEEFMKCGLYDELVSSGLIVQHKEVKRKFAFDGGYKVIIPAQIPFITYPYEWSFSQLKDAALLTLNIQLVALKYGMSLKDASAYNVQFLGAKPIFIDTLSFERYQAGKPWAAYRQFCQHFLAPLAIMKYKDPALLQLMRIYTDGIPLPLASDLLTAGAKINPRLALHLVLHARTQRKYAAAANPRYAEAKVSQNSLVGILTSLKSTVRGLNLKYPKTEWGDYYNFTNYSDKSFSAKRKIVRDFVAQARAKAILDLGSNDGMFSRVAAETADYVISADIDPVSVDKNYVMGKKHKEEKVLPVLLDLSNPSSGIGWAHAERDAFLDRCGKIDLVMALALIHHLSIASNVPLEMVARYFSRHGRWLIIEFVPQEDSQVQKLLATRRNIFTEYNEAGFEKAFSAAYKIEAKKKVPGSKRAIYLMRRRREAQ